MMLFLKKRGDNDAFLKKRGDNDPFLKKRGDSYLTNKNKLCINKI